MTKPINKIELKRDRILAKAGKTEDKITKKEAQDACDAIAAELEVEGGERVRVKVAAVKPLRYVMQIFRGTAPIPDNWGDFYT